MYCNQKKKTMGKKIVLAEDLNGGGGLIKFKIRNKGKILTGIIYEHTFFSTFYGTELSFYPEETISKGIYFELGRNYCATYSTDYKKFVENIIKQYKIEKLEKTW